MTSPTFVLIHGAFRTGWSWNGVVQRLTSDGATAVAVELRGMGGTPASPGERVTLSDWVDDTLDACGGADRVVLVGHSMGGIVAQVAAAHLGPSLDRLVLIDAPLIGRGQRAVDVSSPGPVDESFLPPADTMLPPRPVGPDDGFVDQALAHDVNQRLVPTPFGPSLDEVLVEPPVAELWFCAFTPPVYPSGLCRARCDAEGIAYGLLDSHHDAPLLHPDLVAAALTGGESGRRTPSR